jgi:hypothetical protein
VLGLGKSITSSVTKFIVEKKRVQKQSKNIK